MSLGKSSTEKTEKKEKEKKDPFADLPDINNLAYRGLNYCCGMYELGNFNYIDPEDGKKMTHYHQSSSGWKSQPNAKPTTKAQILEKLQYIGNSGVMATTGAGQEYLEPILEEIGFRRVFTYKNPGHAQTPISVWCYSKNELALGTTQQTMPSGSGGKK